MYLQCYLIVTRRVPRETAADSVYVLRTPYNYAPVYTLHSTPYNYVGLKCVLLWPAACTFGRMAGIFTCCCCNMGWNGYRNKSQYRKFSRRSCGDSNPRLFRHKSEALIIELAPPPSPPSSHLLLMLLLFFNCLLCQAFLLLFCSFVCCCCVVVVPVVVVVRLCFVCFVLFKNVVSAFADMSHKW